MVGQDESKAEGDTKMNVSELAERLKACRGGTLIVDNDCWRLIGAGGVGNEPEELEYDDPPSCDLLAALAKLAGLAIESV
jgi:hypothetical protein